MRELNVNEINEVSGGILWSLPRLIMGGIGAYRTITSIKWGSASYEDMMMAP